MPPGQPPGADCPELPGPDLPIDPKESYALCNRTPWPIRISHPVHGDLCLSALSRRVVRGDILVPFWPQTRELRQLHQLKVRLYRTEPSSAGRMAWFWLAVTVLAIVAAVDLVMYGSLLRPEASAATVAAVAVIGWVLFESVRVERRRRKQETCLDHFEGDVELGGSAAFTDGNETVQRTKQAFLLFMALLIGAVLPAIALFVATDMKDFLVLEGGLRVKDGLESRLVSRVIQAIYAGVLSLFPALLYFQFDRQRVGTIRGRWVRAIFRMNSNMKTLADIEATYGNELSEASSNSSESSRYLAGRHSPILVATILVTLGWTLLVIRTDSFDFSGTNEVAAQVALADDAAQRAEEAASDPNADLATRAAQADAAAQTAAEARAKADVIAERSTTGSTAASTSTTSQAVSPNESSIDDAVAATQGDADETRDAQAEVTQPFFQLLVPNPNATVAAFLGAYFFAMYLVLRGYFRGDLRPKVYNQITARLVTVVILGYLLTALYTGSAEKGPLLALAFFAGVVPQTVLRRIGLGAVSLLPSNTSRLPSLPAAAPATTPPTGPPPPTPPAEAPAAVEPTAGRFGRRAGRRHHRAEARGAEAEAQGEEVLDGRPEQGLVAPGDRQGRRLARALTQVDGIDIYEAALLESEGIADLPSLAKTDLVTMMIGTRVPIERLMDWVDQAVLILLLDEGDDDDLDTRVLRLRTIGIRTARDLVRAAESPATGIRGQAAQILGRGQVARGATLIGWLHDEIVEEPSIKRIDHWHASDLGPTGRCMEIRVKADSDHFALAAS